MTARTAPARPGGSDLGDACVAEALTIIARHGLEALSLRDVARRLGVSHQAPYKHFPSRDHLLAAVMRRCFERFATALRATPPTGSPDADLRALGRSYLRFAAGHPLEYRLMFGTPWPQTADAPDLRPYAASAFDGLCDTLRRLDPTADDRQVTLDALFVWSTMHGLASLLHSSAMDCLDIPQAVAEALPDHAMGRIDRALDGDAPNGSVRHGESGEASGAGGDPSPA